MAKKKRVFTSVAVILFSDIYMHLNMYGLLGKQLFVYDKYIREPVECVRVGTESELVVYFVCSD